MKKEPEIDSNGQEVMKCGFKIGGGIDQDYQKSPQGYTDNVSICVIIFEICTTGDPPLVRFFGPWDTALSGEPH